MSRSNRPERKNGSFKPSRKNTARKPLRFDQRRHKSIEPLEVRQMLSIAPHYDSVTVVIHGASLLGFGDPLTSMGTALSNNYGAGSGMFAYDPDSGQLNKQSGVDLGTANDVIVVFDWETESDRPEAGFDAAAGNALFSMLLANQLANSDYLHLIGHSRGALVASEAARQLLLNGYSVEHVTYLDEEPGPSPYNAAGHAQAWTGIGFVEHYIGDGTKLASGVPLGWELFPMQGEPIAGAYNVRLSDAGFGDLNSDDTVTHVEVREWYEQTISDGFANQGFYWREHVGQQSSAPTQGLRAPLRANSNVFNGDLQYTSLTNFVPGWDYHGGEGNADVESAVGQTFIEFGFAETSRTHNRLYVPRDAAYLSLDYQKFDPNSNDQFDVYLGDRWLGQISLGSVDGQPHKTRFAIPQVRRDQVTSLRMELSAPGPSNVVDLDAQVRIDRIRFETEFTGKTGDVVPVLLRGLHANGGRFALTGGSAILDPADPANRFAIRTEINPNRKDLRLYYETGSGLGIVQHTMGYVVFSERVNGPLFTDSGTFYFAPATSDGLVFDAATAAHGFQGKIALEYSIDGVVYEVILNVTEGSSGAGTDRVTDSAGTLSAMRLQQRLNYLGFRDTTELDSNGVPIPKPLVVDGIIGSRTNSALRKFKATIYPATLTSPTIAFSNTNPDTITDSANGFVVAGFKPGMKISVTGTTGATNNKTFTIASVAPGTITLVATDSLTTQAAGPSVTVADAERTSSELTDLTVLKLNGTGGTLGATQRASLAQGLRQATTKIKPGQLAQLQTPLPLVGSTQTESLSTTSDAADEISLASALDVDNQLATNLLEPLAGYLEATEQPTQSGFETYLSERGIDGIEITEFTPTIGAGANPNLDSFQIIFEFEEHELARQLRLGKDFGLDGLALNGDVLVTLKAQLSGEFNFGLDLTKETLDESFFFQLVELKAKASAKVEGTLGTEVAGRFLTLQASSNALEPLALDVEVRFTSDQRQGNRASKVVN